MDPKATTSGEEQKAHDKVLSTLLSDQLFNTFDPTYRKEVKLSLQSSSSEHYFMLKAFPVLAKYHHGKELDELINGHQWLADLAIPTKRHESAHTFLINPARNLTILDVMVKLSFIKVWGSAMMQYHPSCWVFYEILKIIEAETPNLLSKIDQNFSDRDRKTEPYAETSDEQLWSEDARLEAEMGEEFGEKWTKFVKNYDSALCTSQIQDRSYGNGPPSWISVIKHLSIDERNNICQRAMSAFLENSTKSDFHGLGSWSKFELVRSWFSFRNFKDKGIFGQTQNLVYTWIQARQQVLERLNEDNEDNLWSTTSANFWSFCLAAGCPKADRYNAFKSLEMLRDSISRQFAYTVDLHQRISDLTTQIILQQRMITALAYREVLENLSANTPGNGEVKKWHAFLETMFKAVEKGKNLNENPFTDFFDQDKVEKKHQLHQVKKMAEELYSTLSRTIHNFQPSKGFDQYTPMPGQFDPMQIEFMAAMKPLEENLNSDGKPDWEKERARYPGQVANTRPTMKPEGQRRKGNEAKTSDSEVASSSTSSLKDLLRGQEERAGLGNLTFEEDPESEGSGEDPGSEESSFPFDTVG